MIWLVNDLLDDTTVNLYLKEFETEENFMRSKPIGMGEHVKHNHVTTDDYRNGDHYKKVARHVWKTLDLIRADYHLKRCTQPYFSWYKEGDYYDWHRDNFPIGGINGDLSMTIFLNDDYEGGELLIKVGDIVTTHKPKAGTILLYDTGLNHRVNPVTKGSRKVIVGWHESTIQNSLIRREMIIMGQELNKDVPDWNVLTQVYVNLVREYGRPL